MKVTCKSSVGDHWWQYSVGSWGTSAKCVKTEGASLFCEETLKNIITQYVLLSVLLLKWSIHNSEDATIILDFSP